MNHESLKTLCENYSPQVVEEKLSEALKTGQLDGRTLNLRLFAESLLGPNAKDLLVRGTAGSAQTMQESQSITAFNGITGQIFFNQVTKGLTLAPNDFTSRVRTVQSRLSGEKIPMPGLTTRYGYNILEGEKAPRDSFGRHFFETPPTVKSMKMIELTWESVYYNRAFSTMDEAMDYGRSMQLGKEKRLAACLAGVSVTLDGHTFNGNNWKWCKPSESSSTAYDTYSTTGSGGHPGINKKSGVTFADETDIEALYFLAAKMTHPDDSRLPLGVANELDTIVCTPFNARRILRAVNATEVREETNSNDRVTIAGRGIQNYNVISSIQLYAALIDSGVSASNAAEHFYLCNLNRGLAYVENEPFETKVVDMLGQDAVERDIVWAGRVKEVGQAVVMSPWHLYQSINA